VEPDRDHRPSPSLVVGTHRPMRHASPDASGLRP
jgi:hypothetical protein